ncbi:MAG TPA: hypothetical protein VGJ66_25305 [Pyrinomonadaceae bacterium]|jgi:hypothetical protein
MAITAIHPGEHLAEELTELEMSAVELARQLSMKIRPIKNNRDYREALKEIDRLMDARPNTPEGDRLDVLVTFVEAWEEKHWPIDSTDRV